MKDKMKDDIRNNIYSYMVIVLLSVAFSFILAFVFDEANYIGKTRVYNNFGSEIVEIRVLTDNQEDTEIILDNISNESISQIHGVLNVDVNKSTSVRKNIDFVGTLVRGLIIGLVLSFIALSNVFLPKKKIKSEEDINEIFVDIPILAKIPENYIKEDKENHEGK